MGKEKESELKGLRGEWMDGMKAEMELDRAKSERIVIVSSQAMLWGEKKVVN